MLITFNRKFVLPQKYFQPDVKGEFFRHNCALFTDKFLCYLDNIFSLMWRGFFQMQGKWTMVSLFTDNFLWYLDNIFSLIWRGLLSEARQGHQGEALVSLPCFWQKSPLYQTTIYDLKKSQHFFPKKGRGFPEIHPFWNRRPSLTAPRLWRGLDKKSDANAIK